MKDSFLIDTLNLPEDLRKLSIDELEIISEEARTILIDSVADSGGHFASSLGATELTVALHHCFQTPYDRLVWDVGHQGYIHKILTGRRERLGTIRKKGGLSGFLKRNESEYDAFGAGHAGTSISAAVGMAVALRKSDPQRHVVGIIGDGSLTAGMAFEAMNHAGSLELGNLIIVLNDNEMSISPNVGAISWLFSRAVTSRTSTFARARFKSLHQQGYVPNFVYKAIDRAEEAAQGFFASASMLFEAFGFRYIGPIDGHNLTDLVRSIENAKQQDVPVLIHAYTEKGKGYKPAEADPIKWHGVSPFDPGKGEFIKPISSKKNPPQYTKVFADALIDHAQNDSRIVGITAAMPTGTGLDKLEATLPEQFFDVGICEQHAVTLAAGMACEGMKPVCAIYSTFLQRAYDQVVHDVCIQNLPVVFAMDRAGAVGNDGETHQGVFDLAYLRTLPNMVIMSPKDEGELRHMVHTSLKHDGPIAIRYPRGAGTGVSLDEPYQALEIGKAEMLRRGHDILLICLGPVVSTGLEVAEKVERELGYSVSVMNARFAKPLDSELLSKELPTHRMVCTIEDHALLGGFGSAVLELIDDNKIALQTPLKRFGVGDEFLPHASQNEQYQEQGYDADSIFKYLAAVASQPLAVGFA